MCELYKTHTAYILFLHYIEYNHSVKFDSSSFIWLCLVKWNSSISPHDYILHILIYMPHVYASNMCVLFSLASTEV